MIAFMSVYLVIIGFIIGCVCNITLFIKSVSYHLTLWISVEKGECFILNHSLECLFYCI